MRFTGIDRRLRVANIESSQEYQSARIVQQGLLPKKRHLNRLFNQHFVLYLPKHYISGDFYWVGERHGLKYAVVGDCTGHGISAALLSVLALNLFEYAVMNKGIKKTNKILQEVDKRFIESFSDARSDNFDNPWIDLSMICVDEVNGRLFYSSANRKALLVKNGERIIVKGSDYPIGGWQIEGNRTFDFTEIPYESGDLIYLGSDGYQDQFGGPQGKKFKSKNLHELLFSVRKENMAEQKRIVFDTFDHWKGFEPQVDDVCLMGIKL